MAVVQTDSLLSPTSWVSWFSCQQDHFQAGKKKVFSILPKFLLSLRTATYQQSPGISHQVMDLSCGHQAYSKENSNIFLNKIANDCISCTLSITYAIVKPMNIMSTVVQQIKFCKLIPILILILPEVSNFCFISFFPQKSSCPVLSSRIWRFYSVFCSCRKFAAQKEPSDREKVLVQDNEQGLWDSSMLHVVQLLSRV